MKKYVTSWQLWAGIVGFLVILLVFNTTSLAAILPFAVFLICPVMMFFMMKDHKKH